MTNLFEGSLFIFTLEIMQANYVRNKIRTIVIRSLQPIDVKKIRKTIVNPINQILFSQKDSIGNQLRDSINRCILGK